MLRSLFWVVVSLLFSINILVAPVAAQEVVAETSHEEKGYDPVRMIFDHISDSHEWHVMTVGKAHISVPLPVILYSKERKQLFCFLSSRFHHGHQDYNGFRMLVPEKGGPTEIVEVDARGDILQAPIDFSITKNVAGVLFVCVLMVVVFVSVAKRYKKNPKKAPHGVQNLMEAIILFVRDNIAKPSISEKHLPRFVPILLTIFFFVLFCNLLGLIPIIPAGANLTGNITVTMVLAMFTFLITTFSGNKHYWADIFNTPGVPTFLKFPIPLMPIVELSGMLTKPIVLMIRLFANMLSGHMIVLVFFSMIFLFGAMTAAAAYGVSVLSVFFAVFMTLLDVLVSFIQAYVFTMLSAMYFGMATAGHDAKH